MINGISKIYTKADKKLILIDITSHNRNVREIAKTFHDDFVGQRSLLDKASSIHDSWKRETLTPQAIMDKGAAFRYHGAKFPSRLVDQGFNDVEFDEDARKQNYSNYYVLNLVRFHHAGFSTFNLHKATEFIQELKERPQNQISAFIKDWYALKIADWIDSAILSSYFGAMEVPSILDLSPRSEVDIGRQSRDKYNILQEGFSSGRIRLTYDYSVMNEEELHRILKKYRQHYKQREELNDWFEQSEKDHIGVDLYGD